MIYIPDDVWKVIVQFVSQRDLGNMIEVNRLLFHLGMDARYRSVSFMDFRDTKMVALRRLSDPAIAPRIRHLHVDPSYKQGCAYVGDPPYFLQDNWNPDGEWRKYNSSEEDVMQLLVDSLAVFSNVTHFSINWPVDCPSNEQLQPLLTTAWNTFGSALCKLVIRVDMTNPTILSSIAGRPGFLAALQELELQITGIGHCSYSYDMSRPFVTEVAPFVNQVAPTLRTLSFSSPTWFLDFSLLFNLMEKIPKLEDLRLTLEMGMCGLSDPRGLTRILRDHALTLRHFKWVSDYHRDTGALGAFTDWMEVNQSDTSILSNLLTLEIITPLFTAGFDLVMGYIQRSADTLTSLSLSASYLSHDQVKTVLSIFTHRREENRLEVLRLWVTFLSVELVLTLSRTLPCLHTLVLSVRSIGEEHEEATDLEISTENVRKFADGLAHSNIGHWQLQVYDFWIQYSSHPPDNDLLFMLIRQFMAYVPSIQQINGMDKHDLKD